MDKIVIADTSCLIALENIGALDILKQVYPQILVTEQVKQEFGKSLPEWITVKKVQKTAKLAELEYHLDPGEASSTAPAIETKIYRVR